MKDKSSQTKHSRLKKSESVSHANSRRLIDQEIIFTKHVFANSVSWGKREFLDRLR